MIPAGVLWWRALAQPRRPVHSLVRTEIPTTPGSTLRASVAVRELGVTRAHARSRPTVMTANQIEVVNAWLAGCEIAWIVCSSVEETIALEQVLIAEWRPPINIL